MVGYVMRSCEETHVDCCPYGSLWMDPLWPRVALRTCYTTRTTRGKCTHQNPQQDVIYFTVLLLVKRALLRASLYLLSNIHNTSARQQLSSSVELVVEVVL